MKSIGIKLADGSFYPILSDGGKQKKSLDVTTVKDNQTTVQIDLYRSETDSMDDAEYVDSLEIKNLNPHPNGEPNLHLELSMDEENKLQAKVRDPETGKISSTKVTLISRTAEERNEPANFALGSTKEEREAEKSLLESSNDEDFSFDSISETKPADEIPTEGFLSDSQVLSDSMISDSPLTDSDMLSPDDLFYDNPTENTPDTSSDSETIVDRDGTSFTFENETPLEATPPKDNSETMTDDEMANLFEGISADNFVTIDGSEHTGENGFEIPEEFADLGSDSDFNIPSIDEEIDDAPAEIKTSEETGTQTEEINNQADEKIDDEKADEVQEPLSEPAPEDNSFNIPPLFDESLFDETRAEGSTTSNEDFGTPSTPEPIDENTGDELDKVMENPFPEVDLSDIDDGTEIAAQEKETNYDLPSFDELRTDTSISDDIVPVSDATSTETGILPDIAAEDSTAAENQATESQDFDLDLPDFSDLDNDITEPTKETPAESSPDFDSPADFGPTDDFSSKTISEPESSPETTASTPDTDFGATTESSPTDDLDLPDFKDLPDTESSWENDTSTSSNTEDSFAPTSDSQTDLDLPDFDDFDSSKTTADDLPDFGDPFSTLSSSKSSKDFSLPDFGDSPAKKDLDQETSDFFENFDSNYPSQETETDTNFASQDSFDDGFSDGFDSTDSSKYGYEEDRNNKKKKSRSHILLVAILALLLLAVLLFTIPALLKNKGKIEIADNMDTNETTIVESNTTKSSDVYEEIPVETSDVKSGEVEKSNAASKTVDSGIMGSSSPKKTSDKASEQVKESEQDKKTTQAKKSAQDKKSTADKKSADKASKTDKKESSKKSDAKKGSDKKSKEPLIAPAPKVERVTEPDSHSFTDKKSGKQVGTNATNTAGATSAAKEDTIVVVSTPKAVVPVPPRRADNSPSDIKYKVSRGDTLWDISKAYYKTPWNYERIAEYNGIENPDFIRAGQEILLPVE